ncbi:hypothetical protein [Paenibacillus mesotrionivorans]|uniref:Uncharacterized protein n=1 Tax=Paenibacillus mesotrionivorans TaxID=3160968 RepID=A0ACC7NY78_9BACL
MAKRATDHELKNLVETKRVVRIMMGGRTEHEGVIIGFNDMSIQVIDGYFLRDNILILKP